LTPAEYVKVFNASDININLHSSHERDGVDPFGDFLNPRTFELAASGVFQLVDQRSLLPEAFDVGSEIVTFSSVRELKEQIEYYLAHPEERGRIAQAGRARALKDHTYTARLKQMLSIVFSSRYEQLKNRLDQSPWQKVLSRAKQYPELYERCERAFQRGEEPNLDGLVSDVVTGQGKLSETEQKLMFLFHVRKQIIRMREEETSGKT
jgi:spore maturation protein CgeB